MRDLLPRLTTFASAAAICASLSCGVVGLDDDPLPPTTEVVREGLRFSFETSHGTTRGLNPGPAVHLQLTVRNVSDAPIQRSFAGGCMVREVVAFREGEFAEAAWPREPPELACGLDGISVDVQPGETAQPDRWLRTARISAILEDGLEPGLYRFGAKSVEIGGIGPDAETVELIAPEPIRLESSP